MKNYVRKLRKTTEDVYYCHLIQSDCFKHTAYNVIYIQNQDEEISVKKKCLLKLDSLLHSNMSAGR